MKKKEVHKMICDCTKCLDTSEKPDKFKCCESGCADKNQLKLVMTNTVSTKGPYDDFRDGVKVNIQPNKNPWITSSKLEDAKALLRK